MLGIKISEDWQPLVARFEQTEKGQALEKMIQKQKEQGEKVYPPNPFRAFELIRPKDVKIVILGQDPYHGPHQANGLAFSVFKEVKIPPSLRNIYKEIAREYPGVSFKSGELQGWAEQGVLLLNTVLTVEEGRPGSHAKKGWEKLTDEIIKELAKKESPTVFMLWGNFAKEKAELIKRFGQNCLILQSNHPSPLSASRGPSPFFGNDHFKKANQWLKEKGQEEVDWAKNE